MDIKLFHRAAVVANSEEIEAKTPSPFIHDLVSGEMKHDTPEVAWVIIQRCILRYRPQTTEQLLLLLRYPFLKSVIENEYYRCLDYFLDQFPGIDGNTFITFLCSTRPDRWSRDVWENICGGAIPWQINQSVGMCKHLVEYFMTGFEDDDNHMINTCIMSYSIHPHWECVAYLLRLYKRTDDMGLWIRNLSAAPPQILDLVAQIDINCICQALYGAPLEFIELMFSRYYNPNMIGDWDEGLDRTSDDKSYFEIMTIMTRYGYTPTQNLIDDALDDQKLERALRIYNIARDAGETLRLPSGTID